MRKPDRLYEVRFRKRSEVPSFAAAIRETTALRKAQDLEPHRLFMAWTRVVSDKKHVLLGPMEDMEDTARMLGSFAIRTDQAIQEIEQRHAPHQDPMAVKVERYDLGARCNSLARGIRLGLSSDAIVDPTALAGEVEHYLSLRSAGE